MSEHKIFTMAFGEVYPHYVNKVIRKQRKEEELLQLITWLTGYSEDEIHRVCENKATFREFFAQAPNMNANRNQITGTICGIKIQDIEDPLMKQIRQLDKIVDELAKGRALERIMRHAEYMSK